MAIRARLSAPRPERDNWPWHQAKWTFLPASLLMGGDRRMEAENYLAGGYGIRVAMEARKTGWTYLSDLANVWQPSRLKGIQVSPEFGTPFLAATQVFDLRPVPRKFLSLDRTGNAAERFVTPGMILVTCSGSVGRATLAHKPHENTLISHDLLRVEPRESEEWGWLYAYLRSPQARAMMSAAQYGHMIKHLEVSHLNALPVPCVREELKRDFGDRVKKLLAQRNLTHQLLDEAERLFEDAIGPIPINENSEVGFTIRASSVFTQRRRLEASYHNPATSAILKRFADLGLKVEPLTDVTERVWWMTRFKRVFGEEGVPYMSADELFTLNPPINKRVIINQADNADDYYVKAGWIVMACSGQVYGLNGSVALITKKHEGAFFSHDLVRIIPREKNIRPGYLFAVLGHPKLGRPLVIRYAYGTSIPHLEPADIATFPVVRLGEKLENDIADRMERAVSLRAEADELENSLAADAETLIDRFLAGDTQDFVLGRK
jgi:hypothetical protein